MTGRNGAKYPADLMTYGTPHWGVAFAGLVEPFGDQGARDTDDDCSNGQLRYIGGLLAKDNLFLESLRKKPLPSSVPVTTIGGVKPFSTAHCFRDQSDYFIPFESTSLNVPDNAPENQQSIIPASYTHVRTNKWHGAMTKDFSTILCFLSQNCLIIDLGSPLDLEIKAPDGRLQTFNFVSIPGASYMEFENENGHSTATILIPFPLPGDYKIDVVLKPGALPADTYSIQVTMNGVTEVIAQNVRIQDIPREGYTVNVATTNRVPTANAGTTQIVRLGSLVTLNGNSSSDPDNGPAP